jgi:hypothetical protein
MLSEVDYLGIVRHRTLGLSAAKENLKHASRARYAEFLL